MRWACSAAVALVVAVAAACSSPAAPPAPSAEPSAAPSASSIAPVPWVGSWATALTTGDATFEDRTLRQVVHTSIGGTAARLRLANLYGTEPLVVRNVRLARSTGGPGIDTATDRGVTFGGATEVTIAPGETAASDPVAFAVPALAEVAVSLYLAGTSGPASHHGLANRDNYEGVGDQTAAGTISGARKVSHYYFLAGLDVHNAEAAGAVVTFGASVTDGFGSSFGANRRWPDLLARRFAEDGRTVGVLNTGISGNKLTRDGAGSSGPSGLARFDRDVLGQPGVRWVIVSDDPLNDLGSADPPSAGELVAALGQLVDRGRAAGVKVYCSTLTPFEGAGYWTSAGEAGRDAVNDFLRGNCDGVIDQAAATGDPDDSDRYRGDLDSGDHLHPNDDGMRAIADAVDLSLFG